MPAIDCRFPGINSRHVAVPFRRTLMSSLLALFAMPHFFAGATAPGVAPASWITPAKDGNGFVQSPSGKPFVPWGFNYDRDYKVRLIEEYWDAEWSTLAEHFRKMRDLGANIARVHIQFVKFMNGPDEPNAASLARLEKLVRLAEGLGIYIDLTGLGTYRAKDDPAWYLRMSEPERWAAQGCFWGLSPRR